MTTPLSIVQAAYAAYGRHDVNAILDLVADKVDWKLVGPPQIPYTGQRNDKAEVATFFTQLEQTDDTLLFEPREFIESGDHVVVLGFLRGTARAEGKLIETEWVHVFTVVDGKIRRWRGFADTAARFI
ncbi:nuclear transport factor 2 family protein [Cupriavidus basilensis]|uniref:Nuclear transport factor 2 family protein n=1 Tax=Cupriavidus basilensis TaxID=68895 RepID=A0ABT6AII8_9BURK|nr:nuclear transport factor 2 family protein [Cupriavidus basilensis]MDF3832122.1 nuclear transport factor 2 family protein [Cupriavidus basilensis]